MKYSECIFKMLIQCIMIDITRYINIGKNNYYFLNHSHHNIYVVGKSVWREWQLSGTDPDLVPA